MVTLQFTTISTLDNKRIQLVMENLLNYVVKSCAEIAIIDISGLPGRQSSGPAHCKDGDCYRIDRGRLHR